MNNVWIILSIVGGYLAITSLLGILQSRKLKEAKEFAVSKMPSILAATFLAGFTLGGASTYGVAGDTIKYGLTYLFWFPLSVGLGWWVTGLLFARPYFRLKGITLPTLLGERFDTRTQLASSISMLLYTTFVIVVEIYTLSMVIRAIAPDISMFWAVAISVVSSVGTVAFSGIMGASITNLIHSGMMILAFGLVYVAFWREVGGWNNAIEQVVNILPQIAKPGITEKVWLSPIGLGWGAVGQILLAKAGRLGGISAVSNLAASCETEKDAMKAFWLAGLISAIPPFLACSIGVFTAAYLGPNFGDVPVYSSIGYAASLLNPVLAGIFLAAIAAAILSTFSPLAVAFSSVVIEDFIKRKTNVSERGQRILYPASIIFISILCAIYILTQGITDIMPFVFMTAFPSTIPNTVTAYFGITFDWVDSKSAFWAITLGISISLFWGLVLDDPFGIPNIVVALIVPLSVMLVRWLTVKAGGSFATKAQPK